ncbi:MAG: nickel pincer cofactor biosynthesis protein LarB [Lachnospiraceae bacterium]|nr:nickel pincer cofactor biosynthesis protein LarB [Lachnospiraceae bacterium]
MQKDTIRTLLENVREGTLSVEEALLRFREAPFTDLGYAKVDLHREMRQGMAEVIYGAGKMPAQIEGIVNAMLSAGQKRILITRLSEDAVSALHGISGLTYFKDARLALIGGIPEPDGKGTVVVACAGTSDLPVAEEAAVTAEIYGNKVVRLYDVGVSGLHRTLSHLDEIMGANVIISIAGMEGALTSVLGGLADCPVIGVPTSVGYGASFHGVSALLAMLNSCASGVSVVNIDNGFGAGYLASMINHR